MVQHPPVDGPFPQVADVARQLADRVRSVLPAGGGTRLVCVDGLSGSGKSTLARALASALDAPVIHLDEVYEGWDGLAGAAELLTRWVVEPLRAGGQAGWHPYDWASGDRLDWRPLPPAPVLVLEGCGAGAIGSDLVVLLVWVSAPYRERERRLRSREDWDGYRAHRARWVHQERQMLIRDRTPFRADVVVRTERCQPVSWRGPRRPPASPARSQPPGPHRAARSPHPTHERMSPA
jgi:hypothetical protein